MDDCRAASPGDESIESSQEGCCGQIRNDLQMNGLGREANEQTEVCLQVYWLSGVPLFDSEGASEIKTSRGKGRRCASPLCRKLP